jgi:hypothetical protein
VATAADKDSTLYVVFAKSECRVEWRKGCKLASEISGLPREEAGERWLSGELEREYLDRVTTVPPHLGSAQFDPSYHRQLKDRAKNHAENNDRLKRLEDLKDKILKRLEDRLHEGRWLLRGYDDRGEEQTAAAGLVTFKALKYRWPGSNYIMLGNEMKLFCPWLVMAKAEAPALDPAGHAEGNVSADAKQGRRRVRKWQKIRVLEAVEALRKEGVPVYTLPQAELRHRIEQKLLPSKHGGLACPGRTTINEALKELDLG